MASRVYPPCCLPAAAVGPACPIVLLGAGTPHKRAVLDKHGFVLRESTSYAQYLLQQVAGRLQGGRAAVWGCARLGARHPVPLPGPARLYSAERTPRQPWAAEDSEASQLPLRRALLAVGGGGNRHFEGGLLV